MKISIDARGVNLYKGSGIGTYIENLLRELLNIDKKNNYTIFYIFHMEGKTIKTKTNF